MNKKQQTSKFCSKCNLSKNIKKDFYLAASDTISSDSRLSICKKCLEEVAEIRDVDNFIKVMRMIDRPFLKSDYDASLPSNNPFGEYMRRLGMRQNRDKTYLDSMFEGHFEEMIVKDSSELNKRNNTDKAESFKATPDTILKWGNGYSNSDLYQLEQFYSDMFNGNSITTPQHKAQLLLLSKVNLEQNKAIEEKRFAEFKTLNQQYNNILKDSGFRPIDRQAGNEAIGIRSFSQVWDEIEKYGFIPKHNISVTQDIVDNTIMHVENYTHRLLNMQVMSTPPEDTPQVGEFDEL